MHANTTDVLIGHDIRALDSIMAFDDHPHTPPYQGQLRCDRARHRADARNERHVGSRSGEETSDRWRQGTILPIFPPLSSLIRSGPTGFIEPCLPSPADKPPSGSNWTHEIKHDGYRMMARREPVGIRMLTRRGNDWSGRFPLVVKAVNHLKVRSCPIDGEVVCCDERGLAIFATLRERRNEATAFLYAFDLLELDGNDMRREPIEVRKATLASILRKTRSGVRLNEHLEHPDGELVFAHACKMGLEGIVSKRLGSRYRSGRSPDWLKFKNPEAPAVKREAEEDWGR